MKHPDGGFKNHPTSRCAGPYFSRTSQWFHFPRSAKELTPEAGHAEVFAEAQRVEWMLTQRRSLQDARWMFWSRGRPSDGFSWIWIYSGYMSTWGSTLLLNSWALPWSRGTIIHWYRCIDIQNRSLVITIYHHNYHVSLPSIDHGQPSKFDHGDGQGLSVRRTCNSWRWTWKKVARSPGMWPWAHLGRAGG